VELLLLALVAFAMSNRGGMSPGGTGDFTIPIGIEGRSVPHAHMHDPYHDWRRTQGMVQGFPAYGQSRALRYNEYTGEWR
jgi:hypothetical protein